MGSWAQAGVGRARTLGAPPRSAEGMGTYAGQQTPTRVPSFGKLPTVSYQKGSFLIHTCYWLQSCYLWQATW
jgi:hypothetical protein